VVKDTVFLVQDMDLEINKRDYELYDKVSK